MSHILIDLYNGLLPIHCQAAMLFPSCGLGAIGDTFNDLQEINEAGLKSP